MKSDYNKGFIKIWRNIVLWEWWPDINTSRLWLVILLNANWQDTEWHGITIKRGSLLTSVKELSKMSCLSVQQTRTALKHLEKTNSITIKSTNKFSLITVENYDFWQGDYEKPTSDITSRVADGLTNELTPNKEYYKNPIKNDKNNDDLMDMLAIEELQALYHTYEEAGKLLDIIQDQISCGHTQIKQSAYKYICAYANNKSWPTKRHTEV